MKKDCTKEVVILLKLKIDGNPKITFFSLCKLLRAGRRSLVEMRNCQDCTSITLKKRDERTGAISEIAYDHVGSEWPKHESSKGYFQEIGK